MIRHIALFRWKDRKPITALELQAKLVEVLGRVSEARWDLAVKEGLGLGGPTGYDLGLTVDVEDEETYLAYRSDAQHQALLSDVLIPAAAEIAAIQMKLDRSSM